MAKGTKVRVKGNSQRRIRQREQDSDESDEEYMVDEEYRVGEDEECDDSDEYCSLDGDETDEILADFGKVKFKTETIRRTRSTRRTSPSRRGNTIKKLRKRRMISYTETDEEERLSDFGKVEFKTEADGRAQNTQRISSGRRGNTMKKLRERRVVSYTEDEEEEEEGDAKVMALDKKAYVIERPREKKRVSYAELDDDEDEEDHTESMPLGRKGNRRKKPREKNRVSYAELDDEDEDEEYHTESMPLGRKGNRRKKPREKKRVSYAELDDDDEDEEDHTESMSLGRKGNLRKKPRERRTYIKEEEDEDDGEFMFSGEKENQEKVLRAKRRVSYTEEDDEDDSEFMSSSTDENRIKKSWVKRNVSYKEEEENDAEFVLSESDSSSRDGNKIKRSREKRRVSYKEEEDEDENDTEFMLSESDFDDDEDEGPKMKKSEKVNRYHLQKRSITRGQKKSRNSKILKKPRRSKSRNRRFNRKAGSFKGRSVTNKNQEVEKQSKKISRRRKRRVTADSDSDFVSPSSSDHQYTISEEEREQMKEARVYCANLRAKLRNSSSGRQEEEPMREQRKQPVRKGKEKVEEDTKKELGKQVCGICLSEEGKRTVRGVLNCCRHYFCFTCIMEWSKVESRCPLCKQRFATITKSAKPDSGFDLRAVVIRVPECDQVYQPSEEELRGYLDPYASVVCTECHHGGEDALMLLCDICDSPAHTFCVGLGREVPEGNWYCDGCRPTVFGSLSSQRPTPTSDRRLSSNAFELSSPITGTFDLNELYVPDTPLTEETHVLPESRLPGGDFVPAPAGTVATTLRDRRRIHRHMHRRFLNDSIARSGGTSASSSGIRLFGSQLDDARDSSSQEALAFERSAHPHTCIERREDDVMISTRDTNLYSPRANRFAVQVQSSSLASLDVSFQAEIGRSGATTFDSRLEYAPLHPCTNRPSVRTDASPSPYACREAIGPSRTSQGGIHTPH